MLPSASEIATSLDDFETCESRMVVQMLKRSLAVSAVLALNLLAACAPMASSSSTNNLDNSEANPRPDLSTTHTGLIANFSNVLRSRDAWSIVEWGHSPLTSEFTAATLSALHKYGGALLASRPSDIDSFCRGYNNFTADQKAGFWVALVAGMALRESRFEPTSIYRDSSMGQDHVTGQPLMSEGLLQISYQDQQTYKNYVPQGACDFDFEHDRALPRRDTRRTLQDPARNLSCGVAMINSLIQQDRQIAGFTSGYYQGAARYWAVLRHNPNLSTIRKRTLNYCEAVAAL